MAGRKGTKTSMFGTSGRENHDAGDYYARGLEPIGNENDIDAEHQPETLLPVDCVDRIFLSSSERMDALPDRCVHLMVTSPPYNVGKEYDDNLSVSDHLDLISSVLSETYRVLVTGGRACVNIANIGRKPYIPLHAYIIEAAAQVGFFMRGEIIWNKGMSGASTAWGSWMSPSNPTLRDVHEYILIFQKPPFGRKSATKNCSTISKDGFLEHTKSIWTFPPASAKRAKHPAPFPVELPERLINLYTFAGEVVLDPFMGSGATALAAKQTNRSFVGYELEQEYIETAYARLADGLMNKWLISS